MRPHRRRRHKTTAAARYPRAESQWRNGGRQGIGEKGRRWRDKDWRRKALYPRELGFAPGSEQSWRRKPRRDPRDAVEDESDPLGPPNSDVRRQLRSRPLLSAARRAHNGIRLTCWPHGAAKEKPRGREGVADQADPPVSVPVGFSAVSGCPVGPCGRRERADGSCG